MSSLKTGDGFVDVVVTAVASTTPLAADAEDTWQQLLAGHSGIRPLDLPFVTEFDSAVRIGGRLVETFPDQLNRVERRRLGFMQQMSTVLGRRLWAAGGAPEVDSRRLMVSIGLALGSTEDIAIEYNQWVERGMRAISPLTVQMHMPNSAAAAVGLDHHAKSGVLSPVMADASGSAAIVEAWRHLVLGEADIAICGGVETVIEAVPVAAFTELGMLSTNNDNPAGACRPFDRDRDGMVFGEGGALLLLETEEHAKARGAPILARMMGGAVTSDAYDAIEFNPDGQRAAEAITHAIELAGLTPADIDHVNAHATGSKAGDLAEAHAIGHAFGSRTPAVYAAKAALGNALGATGAIEAVLTVQALRDGVVPPTLNLENLDPGVQLDVVTGEPRRGNYRYAVNNSMGLGGHNVALVLGAY